MNLLGVTLSLALLVLSLNIHAGTVYRFKDENGRWQFSDKKPKQNHDELIQSSRSTPEEPRLRMGTTERGRELIADNPWFAPVTFDILIEGEIVYTWVAEARSKDAAFKNLDDRSIISNKKYGYMIRLGRPVKHSDGQALRPPIPSVGKFMVTQGFGGKFSHSQQPSLYAIDIGMNLSDNIHAARDGIVVFVKDDYHMGGTGKFFLDKANMITVLHSDDTFGLYAHILLGSALVKPGDEVKAGDAIANAGTSGYSTGPHLHFVLQYNSGAAELSSPFVFIGSGRPEYKQWLTITSDD